MHKWATFIQGNYAGPLIQINNEFEFKELQRLVSQNKLFYYDSFCRRDYKGVLSILELNYKHSHPERTFEIDTNNRKSFLVEYSHKGFTYATLHDYDHDRCDPEDWKIIQMTEILEEFK